jgi:uncharacterized membrane protein HdeD (DUF308 family)
MTAIFLERRRTGWDIIVGTLLILAGFVILGDTVLATEISVLLIGWTALFSGVVLLVGSFLRIKSIGFLSAALGGAMLAVLGLFVLRNPDVGAVSLTLLAGSLFLTSGLTRIFVSSHAPALRVPLLISGLISLALGLFVLFNLAEASHTLLGVLLGVQTVLEGATLIIAGRVRPVSGTSV